ncbi:hypothetical protein DFH09DRAFT_1421806 [Mycena vulgaris]|nr:hypothetical protein DFH09DRAFT_1421806 [Mycena vulgaris]
MSTKDEEGGAATAGSASRTALVVSLGGNGDLRDAANANTPHRAGVLSPSGPSTARAGAHAGIPLAKGRQHRTPHQQDDKTLADFVLRSRGLWTLVCSRTSAYERAQARTSKVSKPRCPPRRCLHRGPDSPLAAAQHPWEYPHLRCIRAVAVSTSRSPPPRAYTPVMWDDHPPHPDAHRHAPPAPRAVSTRKPHTARIHIRRVGKRAALASILVAFRIRTRHNASSTSPQRPAYKYSPGIHTQRSLAVHRPRSPAVKTRAPSATPLADAA